MSRWILDQDLRALRFPDPVWVVPGLLREGLAFLVSAPKLGKSWLALQLAYAVATGGTWIGRDLGDPAAVLNIMGEDSLDTLQERCLHLLPAGLDDANLPLAHATEWPGNSFVERFAQLSTLLHHAIEIGQPYKLVIVDTLEIFRGPKANDDKANEYRSDVAILKLLRSLAMETHCTILFLHHTNKIKTAWDEGGDPFEAINGSQGISGTANTIMIIQRARAEPTGVLHVGGHRVKDQKIPLRYDYAAGCWSLDPAGDVDAAVLSGAPRAIYEFLRDGGARTLEFLVCEFGHVHQKETIKKALQRLQQEGKIANVYGLWEVVRRGSQVHPRTGDHDAGGAARVPAQREPAAMEQAGIDAQADQAPLDVQEPAAGPDLAAAAPELPGPVAQSAAGGSGETERSDVQPAVRLDTSDLDLKRAIPASMALLKASIQREGVRYHPSLFPAQPAQLAEVWEGRHKWDATEQLPDGVWISRLDKSAAYLSAANTELPVGAIKPDPEPVRGGRGRAGIHLIDYQPQAYPFGSPLGNRETYGGVWITTPTMRLLDRVHTWLRLPLVDVAASITGPATEVLLRPWIDELRDVRARALEPRDEALYAFVKACYSKTISTMGESNANWEIRRPDWMKIIRAQAYANLYSAAMKVVGHPLTPPAPDGTRPTVVHLGNVDEMWLLGRPVDGKPKLWMPGGESRTCESGLEIGLNLGQWKVKRSWIRGDE